MKQKVLIVEDNISLSQRQKDWLEQAGYDVMTAMREPAARALIRKHRFDFILSDVRLPEGDGLERCDTRYAPQRMGRKSTGGNERHVLV